MQLSNRLVKADFWTDTELIKALPLTGRFLYQGLWQLAEETGVLENDPMAYKMQLFPADTEVEVDNIKEWIEVLVEMGKLIEFSDNGESYFYVKNFHRHQSFSHPPQPELPLPKFVEYIPNHEKRKSGAYAIHYEKINGSHEEGMKFIGKPPEDYEKGTGDACDSHAKGTGDEKEVEVEVEGEVESESEIENTTDEGTVEPSSNENDYNRFAPSTNRGLRYEVIKDIWNKNVPKEVAKIDDVTDKRKRKLRTRFKEKKFNLKKIIDYIKKQEFLYTGDWTVDFDFVIRNDNTYTKILEKNYSNGKQSEAEQREEILGEDEKDVTDVEEVNDE